MSEEKSYERIKKGEDLIDTKKAIELMLGKWFYEVKKNKDFEEINKEKSEFMGEKSIKETTLVEYESVYKAFCEVAKYTIGELAVRGDMLARLKKLKRVFFHGGGRGQLPELTVDRETLDEWVEKAKILSTSDFNLEFKQEFKKFKADPENCKHENSTKHAYINCKDCGEKIWVDPDTGALQHKCN
jgi:hypothetical protein